MIKFHCPNCNQKLGVPDEYAGRRIRCNKCSQPAVVPKPAADGNPQSAHVAQPPSAVKQLTQTSPTNRTSTPAPKPQPIPAAPRKPEPEMIDLELVADNGLPPEDPNLEAIRQAGRQRASKMTFSRPAGKNASSGPSKAGELAKGLGKIPLSIATCFACMAVVIALWVIIGKVTGFEIIYIVVLVPVAGAWGLTRFTEHRGIFLGLLAVVFGLSGMLVGRALIAKMVIMPMWEEDSEFQADQEELQKNIEDSFTTLPDDPELVKEMSKEDEFMIHIAAWDMVQEGKLTQDTFSRMYRYIEYDEEQPEDVQETIASACDRAQIRLDDWNSKQRIDALTKYYTPMQQYCQQSIEPITATGVQAVTFALAFISSFDFFDLILFPIALFYTFKYAAALGGDE